MREMEADGEDGERQTIPHGSLKAARSGAPLNRFVRQSRARRKKKRRVEEKRITFTHWVMWRDCVCQVHLPALGFVYFPLRFSTASTAVVWL